MAVGDVVNGIGAVGAELIFQPSGTVEVAITHCGGYNTWIMFYNGTTNAHLIHTNTTSDLDGILNTKMMINNTNYLKIGSRSGYAMSYSGIQIK